jgi:hypothetical protein
MRRRSAGLGLALACCLAAPALAGTITCADQVGATRAALAERRSDATDAMLREAARLCREERTADALALVHKLREGEPVRPVDRRAAQ